MELSDYDFEVKIRSPIYPTEDTEKLVQCLSKVFPKTKWDIREKTIEGNSKYLTRFKTILEDMQIRDTARNYMKEKIVNNECSFSLSKQAMCNAKVNFSVEKKPLGEVEVIITCDEISELIDNLTETE